MAEARKRGWHPDPFGIHKERYYYADDQPGRLVRDDGRREFYDDIPEQLPAESSAAATDDAPRAKPTTTFAAPARVPSDPPAPLAANAVPARPSPPQDPSQPPEAVEAPPTVEVLATPHGWEEPPAPLWRRGALRISQLSPRTWAGIGVLALAAVLAIVAIAVLLQGPPGHRTVRSEGTNGTGRSTTTSTLGATSTTSAEAFGSSSHAWQVSQTYAGTSSNLEGVTCPISNVCMAVGATTSGSGLVLITLNSGTTWGQEHVPSGVPPLSAISCPQVKTCFAIGGSTVLTTTDTGTTWQAHSLSTVRLLTISCPTQTVCVAAGIAGTGRPGCVAGTTYSTNTAGSKWFTKPVGCFQPSAVSCPSIYACELAGAAAENGHQRGEILVTNDSGQHWRTQYSSPELHSMLSSMSCANVNVCVAGGSGTGALLRTTNAGAKWDPQSIPVATGSAKYLAVDCPSTELCHAVGSAAPLRTADGGDNWILFTMPTGVREFTGVSCATPFACIAVGVTNKGAGTTLRTT